VTTDDPVSEQGLLDAGVSLEEILGGLATGTTTDSVKASSSVVTEVVFAKVAIVEEPYILVLLLAGFLVRFLEGDDRAFDALRVRGVQGAIVGVRKRRRIFRRGLGRVERMRDVGNDPIDLWHTEIAILQKSRCVLSRGDRTSAVLSVLRAY
jgi:hypothetical protein